jgi:hypothetical protein
MRNLIRAARRRASTLAGPFRLLKLHREHPPSLANLALRREQPPRIALFTVLILRENILFLEEWIDHHLRMGVQKVFLYDNSKVERNELDGAGGFHDTTQPGSTIAIEGKSNRHGFNFEQMVEDAEAERLLGELRAKFGPALELREWSPRGPDGKICYGQVQAINQFVEQYRYEFDYTLHIDCDEFLVSPRNLTLPGIVFRLESANRTCGLLASRNFDSRVTLLHDGRLRAPVRSIEYGADALRLHEPRGGTKAIFRMNAVLPNGVAVHGCETILGTLKIDPEDMIFHHYQGRDPLPDKMPTPAFYPGIKQPFIHRVVNREAHKYL